jgi:nucleotide-binding universal stress UspA family protein
MFKKILVPLDKSHLAEQALNPAIWLTQKSDGRLTLLNVQDTPPNFMPDVAELTVNNLHEPLSDFDREYESAREYLNGVRYGLGRTHTDLQWETRIEDGDPASQIIDIAEKEAYDLIVMTTHGYSGLTRWMMGSVAEKVLRRAPCPVMVVRKSRPIRKILLPLDGSTLAESSLPLALAAACYFDAKLTFLQVVPALQSGFLGNEGREMATGQAMSYLNRFASENKIEGVRMKTAVIPGKPGLGILHYAETYETDLIVMTTHGRSGLRRWAYGSVTEKVLRGANCAIMVIRSPKDELTDD